MWTFGFSSFCKQVDRNLGWMLGGIRLEWGPELEEAIDATKLDVAPGEVIRCAWICAMAAAAMGVLVASILFCLGVDPTSGLLVCLLAAGALAYGISTFPLRAVAAKRMKSIGCAPDLVACLIIPLKQNPSLENAVRFAAEHGEGQMAEDLKKALWDVWAGRHRSIGEALPLLGFKWGKHIKGFEEAMYAIRTSQIEKSEERRLAALDRALYSIIASVQQRFNDYISYLRLPTMILFAGGALFPLVVIILLPVMSFLGVEFGSPQLLAAGLFSILVGIFLFSEHTLTKRPVAFKPVDVPEGFPGLPPPGKIRFFRLDGSAWKISCATFIAFFILSVPYLLGVADPLAECLSTVPIVFGFGAGVWVYMYGTAQPKKKLRESLKAMETEAVEAAFHLGNRLVSGMSAEEAFLRASSVLGGETKDEYPSMSNVFRKAVKNIRYFNMGLDASLFDGKRGALKDVSSGTVRSIFRAFSLGMKKSVFSASEALMVSANHIREIRRLESSLKENIAYTTSMIKVTACIINPLICALAVYVSGVFRETIAKTSALSSDYAVDLTGFMLAQPSTSPETLQLITGVYMLVLLAVLMRYVSVLEGGDDRLLQKLEIAKGIPVALATFSCALFLGGIF